MKKLGVVGLVLISVLAALETLVARLGPGENLAADRVWVELAGLRVLAPSLDAWVATSRLETDADGQRRALAGGFTAQSTSVLVAGGRDAAAIGTDDEAHFAAALERSLRQDFGVPSPEVRLWVADGSLEARAASLLEVLGADPPRCVVLQFQPEDLGADPGPFVEPDPHPSVWEGPSDGPLALLRAASHWRERGDRRRFEEQVAGLVARDGLCSRASALARKRAEIFQEQFERSPQESPRLRARMREAYDPVRLRAQRDAVRVLEDLLDRVQRLGCMVLVTTSGPGELLGPVRTAASTLGIPVLAGPPAHLDPSLRIGEPSRPANIVHESWGRSLAAALADQGGLPVDREESPEAARAARALDRELRSFHGRSLGTQLEVEVAARAAIRRSADRSTGWGCTVFRGVSDRDLLVGPVLAFVLQATSGGDVLEIEVEAVERPAPFVLEWWGSERPMPPDSWEEVGEGRWRVRCPTPASPLGLRRWSGEVRWRGEPRGTLRALGFQSVGD